MAEVKAQLKNIRLAPRKVRLVTDLVKGKDAAKAMAQLEFLVRRPAQPLLKLIKSALANAENNFNMVSSNLYIKEFRVDEGAKLRRFRPKAYGRSGEIQKKTSHVRLTLAEKVSGLKVATKAKKESAPEHNHAHEPARTIEHSAKEHRKLPTKPEKPEVKTEIGKENKGAFASAKKKFFQRKSV